jgi:hypothetical protein
VNARTAFIGLFASSLGIIALVLARNMFFQKSGDPFRRNLLVVGLMVAFVLLAGALAGSHRLQMYTFGGGQHAASDDSRDRQWTNTWEHLKKNPVGVGPGNSIWYVGVANFRTDYPVIDSLWINLFVDEGIVGFLVFFGFYLRVGWIGIRTFLRADREEEELAGILGLGLVNYVTVAYVISNTDSAYITMIFAVGILALARQQQERLSGGRALAAPAAMPAIGTALAVR